MKLEEKDTRKSKEKSKYGVFQSVQPPPEGRSVQYRRPKKPYLHCSGDSLQDSVGGRSIYSYVKPVFGVRFCENCLVVFIYRQSDPAEFEVGMDKLCGK